MAHGHYDPVALLPARLHPPLDQRRADALPLEFGQDRHRGEGQRPHRPDLGMIGESLKRMWPTTSPPISAIKDNLT